MKLLGNTKSKITKNENMLYLENDKVILIHFNIVNSGSQQSSTVLYTFLPNKWFFQLLAISQGNFIF